MEKVVPERVVGWEKLLNIKKVNSGKKACERLNVTLRGETIELLRKLKKHNARCVTKEANTCRKLGCDTYNTLIRRLAEGATK